MRRTLIFLVFACGGGAPKKTTTVQPVVSNACAPAYAEYEARWKVARTEELMEVGFDQASTAEVLDIELALLPTTADLQKLRGQYTAVSVFLPDAPWPRALDAAEAAIAVCGEESPRP